MNQKIVTIKMAHKINLQAIDLLVEYKGETSNQLFNVLEEREKNLWGCFKKSAASVSLPESLPEPAPDM